MLNSADPETTFIISVHYVYDHYVCVHLKLLYKMTACMLPLRYLYLSYRKTFKEVDLFL